VLITPLALLAPALAQAAAGVPGWTDLAPRVEALAVQAARQAWTAIPGRSAVAEGEWRVEARAGLPDARLQLAPCAQVDTFLPAGHRAWGLTRVGLRCTSGPVRWSFTVPVTVQVWAPAWRTRTALPAGVTLTAEHLERAPTDWAAAEALPFAQWEALQGRSVQRALPAGHALREPDLQRRQWFAAGDVVRVVAQGNGFSVATDGTALTPGFEGQPARARTDNGRIVTGVATAARRLEVAP
jgi:flagella basal body P-ring formation protein FlgA